MDVRRNKKYLLFTLFLLPLFYFSKIYIDDAIDNHRILHTCPKYPDTLVRKAPLKNKIISVDELEKEFESSEVKYGGMWEPKDCKPRFKLAVIIPHRDRYENLGRLVLNLHNFLMRQKIAYKIYLTEPEMSLVYNKGLSMNAAYVEALKEEKWDCFIFHDVDMIPEDDHLIYECSDEAPKHFAVALSIRNYTNYGYYKVLYYGGVTAYTTEQFKVINGYSNLYFNWGKEDDDIRERVLHKYHKIIRVDPKIGRYFKNLHKNQTRSFISKNTKLLKRGVERMKKDGINSLKYKLTKVEKKRTFTRFFVSYNDKAAYN